jgi:hypothetical protein
MEGIKELRVRGKEGEEVEEEGVDEEVDEEEVVDEEEEVAEELDRTYHCSQLVLLLHASQVLSSMPV